MATARLIVSGNCQARFIANVLAQTPQVTDQFKVVYHRNFRRGDREDLSERTLQNTFVLLEQIAHGVPELPGKALLPRKARVIRFPVVWFNSLWPTFARDPRNPPKAVGPEPWPYGDRIILDAMNLGLSPTQAVQRWFDTDIASSLDLDRFHEINAAKARSLDGLADLKFGEYALSHFQREALFATHNHPSHRMLEVMRDAVFRLLDLQPGCVDVSQASGGMYHTHVPVHPSVAAHFALEWWSPALQARLRNQTLPAQEFWERYAAFSSPDEILSPRDLETSPV